MKRGDIVRNIYAGDKSPLRYMVYLKDSKIRGDTVCDCVCYDLKVRKFYKRDFPTLKETLEVVGHLDEFDALMAALARLKDYDG